LATISSRWNSASTESIPNMARPSAVSVDALFENPQPDPLCAKFGAEGDQVQHGAAEPAQPSDHEGVAGT
jgi:hypothetical protein